MKEFCSRQTLAHSEKKVRRITFFFGAVCVLSLLAFITECLLTRTGNAALMLRVAYATMIPAGFLAIAVYFCFLRPAKTARDHIQGLLDREPDLLEGTFTLGAKPLQIPRSVRVYPVQLDTGKEALRLNLDEEWTCFAPPDGTFVRVQAVRKFITGLETGSASEKAPARRVPRAGLFFRRLLALLPAFLMWGMLTLMICGFVFDRITDTSPQYKITVFADMELRDAPALAERMEEALPAPIRMVKIHPFSYAMLNSSTIRGADIYIVPASETEEYREWFAPLPEELKSLASPDMPDGIPVFDPASGLRAAGSCFLYETAAAPPEPCYLFFGVSSLHLAGSDRTAADAARFLLGID